MSSVESLLNRLGAVQPIGGTAPTQPVAPTTSGARKTGADFGKVFGQTLRDSEPVKFSSHAQNRLLHRQISLSEPQIARLEKSVSNAADKGAESSLVLLDNLAFVVSVRNRTVVTALDQAQTGSHVFTQIDSAVIA